MTDCPYGGVCTVTCEYYSIYGCTRNDDNGDWQDINWQDSDGQLLSTKVESL